MNDSVNGGYATFSLFHTIHLHFNTKSYDYHRYHGKCNISKEAFLNRRDKYVFYALSRKYNLTDVKDFFVSNLFEKPKCWIGDLNTQEGDDVYKKYQKKIQSLTYVFSNDIINLFDKVEKPNDIIMVKGGQEPILLKELYYGNIAAETLIILNHYLKFTDMWNEKIQDDVVYPEFMFKLKKYEPFVSFDTEKFKTILVDKIKEYK
jgi:hypothetical protein